MKRHKSHPDAPSIAPFHQAHFVVQGFISVPLYSASAAGKRDADELNKREAAAKCAYSNVRISAGN